MEEIQPLEDGSVPSFAGTYLEKGVLIASCINEHTKRWLEEVIQRIKPLGDDISLRVGLRKDILRSTRVFFRAHPKLLKKTPEKTNLPLLVSEVGGVQHVKRVSTDSDRSDGSARPEIRNMGTINHVSGLPTLPAVRHFWPLTIDDIRRRSLKRTLKVQWNNSLFCSPKVKKLEIPSSPIRAFALLPK
ncbi:hypothetical protein J6590_003394 [Homalodisca vitripennis]|nr:hypothetical protein J6590_003394 [Homalodisca vitripennis]